jgi:peroxiredoxin Q/BCP
MTRPQAGAAAPDFSLPATDDKTLTLAGLRGRNVVLYFYPKDSTPGCTNEGQAFRDRVDAFAEANTVIIGVSRDSVRSHEKFRTAQSLPFDLVSDPDEVACSAYDVIVDKNMYGRKVRGIERSTFLIDADGVLRREWRKVRVDGHADEVLAAARAL